MGFILLIVFILTIFRAWKQSPLYGRFANRPYDTRKHTHTMPAMFLCIYMYIYTYLHVYLRTFRKHTCRGKVRELAQRSM